VRRFGLAALLLFGVLCAVSVWRDRSLLAWGGGVLAGVGLLLAILPGPLRPVYAAWTWAGRKFGTLTTMVLLAMAFYLVVTPIALLKRRVGGLPLPLEPSGAVDSYWILRPESAQPRDRFFKRY
jgi:hypothetical protein